MTDAEAQLCMTSLGALPPRSARRDFACGCDRLDRAISTPGRPKKGGRRKAESFNDLERFDPETGEQIIEEQLVVPVDLTEIPMSIVIVEEIADVMLFAGKASMQRLAQMRPAGLWPRRTDPWVAHAPGKASSNLEMLSSRSLPITGDLRRCRVADRIAWNANHGNRVRREVDEKEQGGKARSGANKRRLAIGEPLVEPRVPEQEDRAPHEQVVGEPEPAQASGKIHYVDGDCGGGERPERSRAKSRPCGFHDRHEQDNPEYTGGTTGIPKGAMLLHRNLVANMLQIEAWIQPVPEEEPKVDRLTILAALPLYHIFAFTACFLLGFHTGG